MEKRMEDLLPIMGVEHGCLLSKKGDITVAFKMELPEIFSLSNDDYEVFHQAWVKAIRILPKFTVLHKMDWFLDRAFRQDFGNDAEERSFLSRASDRFFFERPYLDHYCYLLLTKMPEGRKAASSIFSNLLRPTLVPEQTVNPAMLQDFLDSVGQFRSILLGSGFVKMEQLRDDELYSGTRKQGLLERYCSLSGPDEVSLQIKDINFKEGIQVGHEQVQIYTLGDAADLPSLCGSRISYDKYSTDKSKFSVGFAANLGQLLPCNHIYNQFIFLGDSQKTIQKLESKRLRLQSLSAYSRENLIARDATNDFLNEALAEQRLPVKAHFNVTLWTDNKDQLKDLKNQVSAALAQLDAVAKQETVGAPQIFWAAIPGNAADFPMNDTFDTFAEQASCFLNLETGYRSSISPVGIRMGDRLTGKPVHVDISDEPVQKGICTNRNKFVLGPSLCRVTLN